MMLKGPDLSKWQGIIDFGKLKSEVDFVILRSTYGVNSVDAKFFEYAAECKRVGIPILGVYHFCYARSTQMAEQEAANCIKAVEKAGLSKNTILFYDLEYDSISAAQKQGVTLDNVSINTYTTAFCHKVKQAGYRTGVYFNKDYYRNKYTKSTLDCYIKWLADYKETPSYQCDLQQVSSSMQVRGINGSVDWNYLWNDGLLINEESKNEIPSAIADKVVSDWSKPARDFCVEKGIFNGDGAGSFNWRDPLTREEAAQLIYNIFQNLDGIRSK